MGWLWGAPGWAEDISWALVTLGPHLTAGLGWVLLPSPGAQRCDFGAGMRPRGACSCADLCVNQAEAEEAEITQAGLFKSGFAWFQLPVLQLRGCISAVRSMS